MLGIFSYIFLPERNIPEHAPLTSKHWSNSPKTSFDNVIFWKQSQFMKFLPHPQQIAQSTYQVILPHQSNAAAVNGTALSTGTLK